MSKKTDNKIKIFFVLILLSFFILFLRLYFLQIIKGDYYVQRSESNFIQERVIKHSRGKIFDRFGNVLADNRKAYDLYLTFAMMPDSTKILRTLSNHLGLNRNDIRIINKQIDNAINSKLKKEIILGEKISHRDCKNINDIIRTQMIDGVLVRISKQGGQGFCDVFLDAFNFPSPHQVFERLSNLLSLEKEKLWEEWQKAKRKALGLGRFKPTLFLADIGFDSYAKVENAISTGFLSGVTVIPSQRRRYIEKDFAVQTIGYVNQVLVEEIRQKDSFYKSGDFIGRNGLEASYENYLRGQDGIERLMVDAKGRRFSESWEKELLGDERILKPVSGFSLRLSIDRDLQKAAQEYFLGQSGSVIVLDIETGLILALASFPKYDANLIVSSDNTDYVKKLLNDKLKPLRNKAIQDHYAPGSTFKVFTAISGLENHLIAPNTRTYCSGLYKLHKTQWRCFKREGHGFIALTESLKASCDGYFYDLGYRLGLANLSATSLVLGFGNKTGIDLVGEIPGILPSNEYYKKRLGFTPPGAVVNMAIGQGDITVTPIQLAVAYAAIANGGKILKPQLVQEILDENGNIIKTFEPQVKQDISDISFAFTDILQGLSNVSEPGGTASSLRYKPEFSDIASWLNREKISLMGKTGTAQVVKLAKHIKHLEAKDVSYEQRDHAWFVGIFPPKKPQIVLVGMAEHEGLGGAMAAPTIARLMKKYQELRRINFAKN